MKAKEARELVDKFNKISKRDQILSEIKINASQGLSKLYLSRFLSPADIIFFEKLGYTFKSDLTISSLNW